MIHVIQSYVIYGSKIHKKIKTLTWLNEQGSQHFFCYKYQRPVMLTAAVQMEHNQNTIAAINHQGAIQINFHDHS